MSQKRVRNAPAIPVHPAPVVDDWPYVLHVDVLAGLPASIRHDFEARPDPHFTHRIIVGTPPRAVVIDADGIKPYSELDYRIGWR